MRLHIRKTKNIKRVYLEGLKNFYPIQGIIQIQGSQSRMPPAGIAKKKLKFTGCPKKSLPSMSLQVYTPVSPVHSPRPSIPPPHFPERGTHHFSPSRFPLHPTSTGTTTEDLLRATTTMHHQGNTSNGCASRGVPYNQPLMLGVYGCHTYGGTGYGTHIRMLYLRHTYNVHTSPRYAIRTAYLYTYNVRTFAP